MSGVLDHPPSDYVDGRFLELAPGGDDAGIESRDPSAPVRVIWRGRPEAAHVDAAVAAARRALPAWSALPMAERADALQRWKAVTARRADNVAALICDEMGKTMAECRGEAKALGAKVDVTLGEYSLRRVREYEVEIGPQRAGRCRYKPHGVMAVIGPFNFPAHLPNGHFVPALLMGDTVVVKPSEKTPGVGQLLAEMMDEAGLPPGVFNVVQGDGPIAAALVDHDDIDGVLFTGSWGVGRRILEANLDRPGRIIALEMGGNNPAVVLADAPRRLALIECARAAFATTGQRCTCTRRLLVDRPIADEFIATFARIASTLVVGPGRSEAPVFMGPLVSDAARENVLAQQRELVAGGARVVLQSTAADAGEGGHFLGAGILEVDRFTLDRDVEIFGPVLQVAVVDGLEDAIAQANATRYGLAASIFTADEGAYEAFHAGVRAGCINWNTGTAGASSALPFGGLGHSGNHRPAAAFAVDYCAYPVASMVDRVGEAAVPAGMRVE